MIQSGEPIAAVLMAPGEGSYLPSIFAHWFEATQQPGRYIPLTTERADLAQVIAALPKVGFAGLHISPAYQQEVLDLADIVTDRAALMAGANTLIFRKDGKVHADNTDGYGFIENIRQTQSGWNPKSGPAALFGAGRMSKVAIAALLEVGVDKIRVAARRKPMAEALRSEFGTRIEVVDWLQAGNAVDGASLVINATPLGEPGQPEFRVPLDAMRRGTLAVDMVLRSQSTRFLEEAAAMGAFVADGIGMILCQATPSFERWFGSRPPVDEAAREAVLAP